MGPNELFKRRHYGTPQSVMLLLTNYLVFAICLSLFASCKPISVFFWIGMGVLAVYNFLNIRKDREEYTRTRIIAYIVSVLLMVALFFIFMAKAPNC